MKHKILLLEGISSAARSRLEEGGFHVETDTSSYQGKDLIERARGYHALGIRSKTKMTEEVIQALPDLVVIGAFCIGTNQIHLDAARLAGIPAFNAPYSNTRSVAELVLSEMIALSRQMAERSQMAHQGKWLKSSKGSREVRGKTLGIVGYGHIGSQLSVLAESLGLKVVYYDIVKVLPLGNAKPLDSLEELLQVADFVSFHVPETPITQNMVGVEQIQCMKKGAYLINASRGSVVDILALSAALQSGYLAGAAVDVFPKEPDNNDELFHSELQGLANVILTPHIGGSTEEAQEAIGVEVSESLLRFLSLGSTYGAVNFPLLDPPSFNGSHRIINVHRNVPGVLSEINSIVTEVGANIERQFLSTDSDIGYLILDIDRADAQTVANKIKEVKTSIKTNLLK